MAQRELNKKTIRHYCQPGKLIYYIFNFQRGRGEYSHKFPFPRLVVFFWGQNFQIYCFLGVSCFFLAGGRGSRNIGTFMG
jgi:hypothetical protein